MPEMPACSRNVLDGSKTRFSCKTDVMFCPGSWSAIHPPPVQSWADCTRRKANPANLSRFAGSSRRRFRCGLQQAVVAAVVVAVVAVVISVVVAAMVVATVVVVAVVTVVVASVVALVVIAVVVALVVVVAMVVATVV